MHITADGNGTQATHVTLLRTLLRTQPRSIHETFCSKDSQVGNNHVFITHTPVNPDSMAVGFPESRRCFGSRDTTQVNFMFNDSDPEVASRA
jgi:hypothetical protein